jgi:signal transduction histidine kinase
VISNLITNAIKYGSGSRINARLGIHGDRIRFSITDGGIGIAENDHARIFERFERAIGFENVSGLGLGLFITRQIVESLDGKIAVESDVGRGSTFTVDLPREELS